jgi:hypothetical protein
MGLELSAVYADGWDGGVVNPLSRAIAEARDAAGEPYTVVLLAGDRRHAVLDIAWGDGFCRVDRNDAADHVVSSHELRGTADGDLFLRRARTWTGPADTGVHEFPHVAARHETIYRLTGRRTDIDEPRGDRGGRNDSHTTQPPPRLPRPRFGQWHELLGLAGDVPAGIVDAGHHPLPTRTASGPPWSPPRPLQPDGVEELFAAGSERLIADRRLRLSTRTTGPLGLPSGALMAADPSYLKYGSHPFTVTVTPGVYPVTVSLATFLDDPVHSRVVAARLDISTRPVARWEPALRAGQDLLDLGEDEFFGFGVDAGMACFVDAGACDRLSDTWRDLGRELGRTSYTVVGSSDMVAWSSGWGDGDYPTWIGRDAGGAVVCFVADMLLFEDD